MRTLLSIAAALTLTLVAFTSVRADEATDKEVQAVLAKAIEAHGGEQNLTKYKALTTKGKGKVHVNGMDIDFGMTVIVQQPEQLWLEMTFDVQGLSFAFIQGLDGDKGWQKLMDKVSDMDKDAIAEGREQMHAQRVAKLVALKDKAYTLKPLGEIKIGDQPAVGVLVSKKDRRDVSLYFDKKTYLLVKLESRGKDVQGGGQEFSGELLFSDYKEIEGVKYPMKAVSKRDGKDFLEIAYSEITPQDKLDATTFAKPK